MPHSDYEFAFIVLNQRIYNYIYYKVSLTYIFLGAAAVYKYAVKGFAAAEEEFAAEAEAEPVLKYLKAIQDLNHAQDAETAARLIESHDLCLDHIPTKFLKTKEVILLFIK